VRQCQREAEREREGKRERKHYAKINRERVNNNEIERR